MGLLLFSRNKVFYFPGLGEMKRELPGKVGAHMHGVFKMSHCRKAIFRKARPMILSYMDRVNKDKMK